MASDAKSLIRSCLDDFLQKHNIRCQLDDILIDYLHGIFDDEGSIDDDVSDFALMMDAYCSGFAQIERNAIANWMSRICSQLQQSGKVTTNHTELHEATISTNTSLTFNKAPSSPLEAKSSSTVDETLATNHDRNATPNTPNAPNASNASTLLRSLFPLATDADIDTALSRARGDVDAAADVLIDLMEVKSTDCQATKCRRGDSTSLPTEVDESIRRRILGRYDYVADGATPAVVSPHTPDPSGEQQRRYLNDAVVTTRGERRVDVKPKGEDSEEMKKTYVNLKPARKYRFH